METVKYKYVINKETREKVSIEEVKKNYNLLRDNLKCPNNSCDVEITAVIHARKPYFKGKNNMMHSEMCEYKLETCKKFIELSEKGPETRMAIENSLKRLIDNMKRIKQNNENTDAEKISENLRIENNFQIIIHKKNIKKLPVKKLELINEKDYNVEKNFYGKFKIKTTIFENNQFIRLYNDKLICSLEVNNYNQLQESFLLEDNKNFFVAFSGVLKKKGVYINCNLKKTNLLFFSEVNN